MSKDGLSALIRADMEPFISQLFQLEQIFATSSAFLRAKRVPTVELGRRLWADVHLEALGWAFVGLVILLVAVLVATAGGM